MAKLVFLQRTEKEIEIFGGDVFFDIDGKNAGKLSLSNQTVELPAGEHIIKMYKSHTYDTFIGFAEQTINLGEDESLLVKYSCPMMVSQPGNIVISAYSEAKEAEAVRARDNAIQRDFIAQETQKKEAAEKYKNGVWILIAIAVAIGIFYGIAMASIY
jgi:hypothetical protein